MSSLVMPSVMVRSLSPPNADMQTLRVPAGRPEISDISARRHRGQRRAINIPQACMVISTPGVLMARLAIKLVSLDLVLLSELEQFLASGISRRQPGRQSATPGSLIIVSHGIPYSRVITMLP